MNHRCGKTRNADYTLSRRQHITKGMLFQRLLWRLWACRDWFASPTPLEYQPPEKAEERAKSLGGEDERCAARTTPTDTVAAPVASGRTQLFGNTNMTNDAPGALVPLGILARSHEPVTVIFPGTSVSGRINADHSLPMNVRVTSGSNSSVNVPRASAGTSMISVAKYQR